MTFTSEQGRGEPLNTEQFLTCRAPAYWFRVITYILWSAARTCQPGFSLDKRTHIIEKSASANTV